MPTDEDNFWGKIDTRHLIAGQRELIDDFRRKEQEERDRPKNRALNRETFAADLERIEAAKADFAALNKLLSRIFGGETIKFPYISLDTILGCYPSECEKQLKEIIAELDDTLHEAGARVLKYTRSAAAEREIQKFTQGASRSIQISDPAVCRSPGPFLTHSTAAPKPAMSGMPPSSEVGDTMNSVALAQTGSRTRGY